MATLKPIPFFHIGKERTELRKNNFIEKHNLLSAHVGKSETKSVWYTREHIVKLLEEIDHAGGDGLRLHFGTYEQGHEFAGQLCLVMNVTREIKIGNVISHVNVILEEEPDFAQRTTLSRDFDPDAKPTPKDFNFGSPCPPRCD